MSLTTDRPQPSAPTEEQPRTGDPFVAGALLTTAALLIGYQFIALHVIPPLAIFGVLTGVLGAATLRRRSRWLLVLDALVAVLYLAGSQPFMAANLAHPESPVSFLADVFLVLALATVLVGVVLRWRDAGDAPRRRTLATVGVLAVVATVGSLAAAATLDADAREDGDVAVAIDRSTFPEELDAASDGVLWIDNRDPFHHTFVIDDTDVHVDLPASTTVRVPLDLAPGDYRFWCDVPGHQMEGTIRVR